MHFNYIYIITLLILLFENTRLFDASSLTAVHTTTSIHRFHRKRIRCLEWGQFKTEAYLIAVTVKTDPFENVIRIACKYAKGGCGNVVMEKFLFFSPFQKDYHFSYNENMSKFRRLFVLLVYLFTQRNNSL